MDSNHRPLGLCPGANLVNQLAQSRSKVNVDLGQSYETWPIRTLLSIRRLDDVWTRTTGERRRRSSAKAIFQLAEKKGPI